tara:strand:+ start:1135 stop:1332 length:198 start_codon:yes stop_codon:yes gene_type:complete
MPIPLCNKYSERDENKKINNTIIDKENDIDTSLIPSIPSRKVFTTYSIGLAIDIDLQKSGRILIE